MTLGLAIKIPQGCKLDLFLLIDQRTLKDRPRIKPCVIGPPETPSVVISIFLNRQVNQ
jgi:hypothetical protein